MGKQRAHQPKSTKKKSKPKVDFKKARQQKLKLPSAKIIKKQLEDLERLEILQEQGPAKRYTTNNTYHDVPEEEQVPEKEQKTKKNLAYLTKLK